MEKRVSMLPHKPHATSQPSRFSHTPRISTDSAFIAEHFQHCCDSTCAQMDRLVGLPLYPHTKWSALHNCL